ncbi:2-polyprenyl-6-methoxyphenol hydroxylase-like FAD-dependent oxidoreductase [Nocardia transvalensis]|uniref:2-polyprenyl-6-methoxyphenol hydroxylase-like FAD-dependent oxidoreductase n=1 Tax=Nocardia transvalensis TaxID=37333 RepID=A0A7W9PF12_9NOCA|nr:FAD-dependent monooxygenase [Nocardia transvalensis]MBB5914981.1 2-polyprenyl-6-methoxyphenol hydroxylase-like FAD-dependent oxidoreductase [Nocardia transvalensis]
MSIRTALVIGGGIAGPVAATALRKAGIEARVYEAYPGPAFNIGSALGFAPNGLAALDVIDAGDAVRKVALPITRSVMSLGHKQIEAPSPEGVEPLHVVDRSALHEVLHDTAVAQGVPFEYGKRLTGVDEHGDGVTARFADGSSATADVLIGADGIKSRVRGLIDPSAPAAEYLGMLGFGAYTRCSFEIPPETMVFAYGKNAYYLYWSMPDGGVAWGVNLPHKQYMSLTEARQVPAEQWLRILRETYADDVPGAELARNTTPEQLVSAGALHIMPPVPTWSRGRMVLVGDAVHAPSNSTGQGASLAIESAVQLARCLRDFDDPATAFATYERIRRPRVEKIAARGAKISHSKTMGPIMRRMMPIMMPLATKLMKMEETMLREQSYTIDWEAPVDIEAELAQG